MNNKKQVNKDNLKKYISNKKLYNKILDVEEFQDLVNLMVNPIDKALLLCFYNFVVGEQMYEIRSLTIENVDVENQRVYVKTTPEAELREQKVSEELIEQLVLTEKSTDYYRNDGEDWVVGTGSKPTQKFIESPYLFKPTRRGSSDGSMFTLSGVNSKIRNIREYADFPYITPTSIRDTRIVHEIVKEMQKHELYEPSDKTYETVKDKLAKICGHKLSHMSLYSIKQKVKQLLEIKEF